MINRTEVVIVGAGVVGCATAYFLARQGIQVTVIEKEGVASCASGFAAGLLNPLNLHDISGPGNQLTLDSFGMHVRLAQEVKDETGVDPQLRPMPYVWVLFNEAEAADLTELHGLSQTVEGFRTWWLDRHELQSLDPRLSPHIIKGLRMEGPLQVAAYEYTVALAEAATRHGAHILKDTVRGLIRTNGRVSGVILSGEEVACEKVVLAMGPWAGLAESWLGTPVPVWPLKGQILRLELPGPPLEHVFYSCGGGYISSKSDGLVWVGTTEERVGFDDRPTPGARESIMKGAQEIMPALSGARLSLQTACLRPASDDGLPIIGPVEGWDGVYLATGAGRKGILLGPAMAQAIADLVTTGNTDLPIEPLCLSRFAHA